MATLTLYHRTTPERAARIVATGSMTSRENTGEVYASNVCDGHAEGYGPAVVIIRVSERYATLDDEFPAGELHYRINPRHVRVVGLGERR